MPAVFSLIGILGLFVGARAARQAYRRMRETGGAWWRTQSIPSLIGLGLAFVLAGGRYTVSESVEVVGFPFPAATFENRGGVTMDFVGPTTVPALIANVAFFLLLPQVFVAWRLKRRVQIPAA